VLFPISSSAAISRRLPRRISFGIGLPCSSIRRLITSVSSLYATCRAWPYRSLYVTSHLISISPCTLRFTIWMSILPFFDRLCAGNCDSTCSVRITFRGGGGGTPSGGVAMSCSTPVFRDFAMGSPSAAAAATAALLLLSKYSKYSKYSSDSHTYDSKGDIRKIVSSSNPFRLLK